MTRFFLVLVQRTLLIFILMATICLLEGRPRLLMRRLLKAVAATLLRTCLVIILGRRFALVVVIREYWQVLFVHNFSQEILRNQNVKQVVDGNETLVDGALLAIIGATCPPSS